MFEPTVPNLLPVFRILLVPVLAAVLLNEVPGGDAVAAGIFILASVTDVADGYLARRNDDITTFGKLMDPLADKLLVVAALVSLVSLDRLAAWVAMVVIARELAVTMLRMAASPRGGVAPAAPLGKLKTVLQVAMVLALIAVGSPAWVDVLVHVTAAVTVLSGVDFVFGLRRRAAATRPATRHA